MTWRYIIWMAAGLAGNASAVEPHVPVKWPVMWYDPAIVATASPAPATSNSDSRAIIPFSPSLIPLSAAVIVSLTPEFRPVIECLVDPGYDTGIEEKAIDAIAGLVLSAPIAVNKAAPAGRYLVRVSTLFGRAWVEPPPRQPILPVCDRPVWSWFWNPMSAPRPASRVQPVYPDRALDEEIEGEVIILLDIFSNGDAIPVCLSGATPPGWFEDAALTAVSQWKFQKNLERGHYSVTVKFKLEE